MTWVVGTASFFGASFLVSDICVTFRDNTGNKEYRDSLQKIYPLGPLIMGGFSGSVQIGFKMLEQLRRESSKLDQNEAWNMDIVANTWWPRVARRIFRLSDEKERKLGCSVIIASVHPTKKRGVAPWSWTDIHVFRSPNFEPITAPQGKAVSIGSGSVVSIYVAALEDVHRNPAFMQAIMSGENMQAMMFADVVGHAVETNPQPGVSSHVQYGVITGKGGKVFNREYTIFHEGGKLIEVKLPEIARGYDEFLAQCRKFNQSAAMASCR